jgi:FAD/FMN-containing dehydrogenase
VQTFTQLGIKFAVRGGGHMPISGSNNIDAPGILLSMTNLNSLALKDNNNIVSVGAGLRWARVYDYLSEAALVVVGGRLGEIGVSSLLLGGGISFHSGQHGFASDNVAKYEVSTCRWVSSLCTNSCSAYWLMGQLLKLPRTTRTLASSGLSKPAATLSVL